MRIKRNYIVSAERAQARLRDLLARNDATVDRGNWDDRADRSAEKREIFLVNSPSIQFFILRQRKFDRLHATSRIVTQRRNSTQLRHCGHLVQFYFRTIVTGLFN